MCGQTRTRTTFQLSGFFPIERFWMKWALFLLETGKSRKKCPRKTQVYLAQFSFSSFFLGGGPKDGFVAMSCLLGRPWPPELELGGDLQGEDLVPRRRSVRRGLGRGLFGAGAGGGGGRGFSGSP